MTPAEFRRLALSLPSVEENAHMGHPDFRVAGKIFATLGYPDSRFGTIMVSPQEQHLLIRDHPKAFVPASGAWGRAGSTSVLLRLAPRRAVAVALEAAWHRRAPKKLAAMSSSREPISGGARRSRAVKRSVEARGAAALPRPVLLSAGTTPQKSPNR